MHIVCHIAVYGRGNELSGVEIAVYQKGLGGTKKHSHDIHNQNAGKIEEIKSECTHYLLDGTAEIVEEIEEDQNHKGISRCIGKHIGEKPPNLPLENQGFVKAQIVIERDTAVCHTEEINDCRADHNIEHQIGNALVSVHYTVSIKFLPDFFQEKPTPFVTFTNISAFFQKVHKSLQTKTLTNRENMIRYHRKMHTALSRAVEGTAR